MKIKYKTLESLKNTPDISINNGNVESSKYRKFNTTRLIGLELEINADNDISDIFVTKTNENFESGWYVYPSAIEEIKEN